MNGNLETLGAALGGTILIVGTQLNSDDVRQFAFALGFSTVGACAGALAASLIIKGISSQEMRKRFLVNLLCGIPLGIGLAYFVNHFCEFVPLWSSLIGASAVCGWMGVKAMVIAVKKYGKNP